MAEVVIAPARRLGLRRATSFNDIGHLPIGDRSAIIRQKLDDDTLSSESIGPHIKDRTERNEKYNRQELRINKRSDVGKKSDEVKPSLFDQQVMRDFNVRNSDRTTKNRVIDEKLQNCNLVSMPFVTAEPMRIQPCSDENT